MTEEKKVNRFWKQKMRANKTIQKYWSTSRISN